MVSNTVYKFFVLTWGLTYFLKRRNFKKRCVEIEDWGFSVHFVLGFQKNSIYTLHLCFSQDITKWCKAYTKTESWLQKLHEEFGQLQTSSGKSKKLKFNGLLLFKKYIPSAKTLYTKDLNNITFNYLCKISPNFLCHVWKHKSFFTTKRKKDNKEKVFL